MPLDHQPLYKAARVAARSRFAELPLMRLDRGMPVYRNVTAAVGRGLSAANLARTVPSGEYSSEENAWNRWTGRAADGAPGVGGVYATLDLDALLGELLHYTFGTSLEADLRNTGRPPAKSRPAPLTPAGLGDKLPKRRLFVYTLAEGVALGDLSPDTGRGRGFLEEVWAADVVRDAAASTPYRTMRAAYDASRDHSFARGVAHGLWEASGRKLDGIRVTSVRTERATTLGQSGFNLIFFGPDGARIDVLTPQRQVDFVAAPTGGVREEVTWFTPGSGPRTPAGPSAPVPPTALAKR